MPRGVVISDLHLLTHRTRANEELPRALEMAKGADAFVINGDLFVFTSHNVQPNTEAIRQGIAWLSEFCDRLSGLDVYLTLGNHDAHREFIERINGGEVGRDNLTLHPECFRLGSNVFIHGDFANFPMSVKTYRRIRSRTHLHPVRGPLELTVQDICDRTRLTTLVHYAVFPRPGVMARRAFHFLKRLDPGLLEGCTDVYLGHSHIPFRDCRYKGIRFHNTGGAVVAMRSWPMTFTWEDD